MRRSRVDRLLRRRRVRRRLRRAPAPFSGGRSSRVSGARALDGTIRPSARGPPAALARFAELTAQPSRDPLAALARPNAATAALDRMVERFAARDWDGMRALCLPEMKSDDRRRQVLLTIDLDRWLADWGDRAD